MAFDYGPLRNVADQLVTDFGQAGTLRRYASSGGDAYNPTEGVATDHTCVVVVGNWTKSQLAGGSVLATDKKVLVSVGSLAVEPNPETDKMLFGGMEYTIIAPVQQVQPAGTNLLWILQCRA